jgi:hypothetical protein
MNTLRLIITSVDSWTLTTFNAPPELRSRG